MLEAVSFTLKVSRRSWHQWPIPRHLVERHAIKIGDEFRVHVIQGTQTYDMKKRVVGKRYVLNVTPRKELFVDSLLTDQPRFLLTRPVSDLNLNHQIASLRELPKSDLGLLLSLQPIKPNVSQRTIQVFERSQIVVAAVHLRAAGTCEDCKSLAPFKKRGTGEPYLEVHHVIPLSKGGDDTFDNTLALCPNCHRKRHHG